MSRMKIALCLMAQDFEHLKRQFNANINGSQDMYELRVDALLDGNFKDVESICDLIRYMKGVDDKEIILTLRTEEEGGNQSLSAREYQAIIQSYITEMTEDGKPEYIDIEAFGGETEDRQETISFLVDLAHENGFKVILSNHEMKTTPKKEEIVRRLETMSLMGADIPKVAYMATKEEDVAALVEAAREIKDSLGKPFVALSMGELGTMTRVAGGDFGSTITFGYEEGVKAAPGQLSVTELDNKMRLRYRY